MTEAQKLRNERGRKNKGPHKKPSKKADLGLLIMLVNPRDSKQVEVARVAKDKIPFTTGIPTGVLDNLGNPIGSLMIGRRLVDHNIQPESTLVIAERGYEFMILAPYNNRTHDIGQPTTYNGEQKQCTKVIPFGQCGKYRSLQQFCWSLLCDQYFGTMEIGTNALTKMIELINENIRKTGQPENSRVPVAEQPEEPMER